MTCVRPIPVVVPRIRAMPVVPRIRAMPMLVSTTQPVPVLVPRRRLRDRFTEQQLEELEEIFQRNPHLCAEEG